jgi:peptide deformylase
MVRRFFVICSIFCSLYFLFIQCKKDPEIQLNTTSVDSLAFTQAEKNIIFGNGRDSLMYVMNYFIHADSIVLRTPSRNVNLNDTATLFYLIDRMLVTVKDPNHLGVGIAAPQVGICRKMIWVQRYGKGTFSSHPWEVYLNPRITRYSDTTQMMSDGCLSIPGVSANSRRAIWVEIEYDLPDGSHHAEHISQKYTAHIFQHEIDHLYGVLFIDKLF